MGPYELFCTAVFFINHTMKPLDDGQPNVKSYIQYSSSVVTSLVNLFVASGYQGTVFFQVSWKLVPNPTISYSVPGSSPSILGLHFVATAWFLDKVRTWTLLLLRE